MKWLVYGGNGWIGSMLCDFIIKKYETDILIQSEYRADDEVNVEKEILTTAPDRILCVVGRTGGPGCPTIDYLQKEDRLHTNIRDNLYAPMVLTILCERYDIHLTYFGTGCIFDDKDKIYTENDAPDFFGSHYSVVKGFTDRFMHLFDKNVLNVRIRMPIVGYHHPRNFITKIVSYEKVCSIPNSMSVLPDIIPIVIDLSIRRHTGTINMTNPGVIDHNEVLSLYKKYVDPTFEWQNMSKEEQNSILLCQRSNNHLDSSKLLSLYPTLPNIKTSIRDLCERWCLR